jgi:hypothetical protein
LLLLITTFITAFGIEALGTLVSVIGLSLLFGANPIIIALAVALDVNKIINVTLLYSRWKDLGYLMRSYALVATTVTMIITSAGAYSFLTGEFQKAMLGSQEGAIQVTTLKEQQTKYEARKKQIDDQIARVPDTMSAKDRGRVIANFKVEQRDLQLKIAEIDKQLPAMQVKQLSIEAKTGPIITISKTFNITPEEAIKWVILTIIFVFDPLAVFDIVAGNFLLAERRRKKAERSGPIDIAPRRKERDVFGDAYDEVEAARAAVGQAHYAPQELIERMSDEGKAEPPKDDVVSDASSVSAQPQPPDEPQPPAEVAEDIWHPEAPILEDVVEETADQKRWYRQRRGHNRPQLPDEIELDELNADADSIQAALQAQRERHTLESLGLDHSKGLLRTIEP